MDSNSLSTTTSASLLDSVKALDGRAWQRMVELYGPLVYRWCRRSQLQAADAKDVVQEVFCAVATHVADFRREEGHGGFRAWLFTITRNKVRDFYRRRCEEPTAQGGTGAYERLSGIPQEPADGALRADQADHVLLVRRAIRLVQNEFEERTWDMFCRVAMLGHKPAEVAASLGVGVAAVHQAKSRVFRRLRRLLDATPA
ncbi:MAG: sigma-70 family RNA polymerase sigma factor [Planctomycetota bacterium]|nr:sigma-70 family RNA polymerase sigma factor [Planctomycetota bacterium]